LHEVLIFLANHTIDVQLSKDGVPVIYHNFTIGSRSIGDLDVSELRAILKPDVAGKSSGFCTLSEALSQVDHSVGFNIELKYPIHGEKYDFVPRLVGINVYCDRVLRVVYDYAKTGRPVFFSSFNPYVSF